MKKNFTNIINTALIALSGLLFCDSVAAATYINYTRLILSEKDREVTFTIRNEGSTPSLMQLWTDRDNVLDRPEDIKMPFLILPPVFRLEAKGAYTVRLQLLPDKIALPQNKESLFWLNVMEVPPKTTSGNSNALQIAFRSRIKVFYRPSAIASANTGKAIKDLRITTGNCTGKPCIHIQNISPLHLTLTDITLTNRRIIKELPDGGMVSPFTTLDVPTGTESISGNAVSAFSWIDDYGVINKYPK